MASLSPISGQLGNNQAAHLLRRATFGPRIQDISTFAGMTATQAFQALTQAQALPSFPVDDMSGTDWIYPNVKHPDQFTSTLATYTSSWWLENMRVSETNLTDRMVWFYHTHIPMIMSRIDWRPQFPIDYLRLLRHYALGNFKDLAKAICIDNAMLIHLDGDLNVKGAPQENFAREFLELFTVGKGPEVSAGNYTTFTEQDVQALTRVLTGWGIDDTFQTIDPQTNIPTGKVKSWNGTEATQHTVGDKVFSSAFNNTVISTSETIGSNASVQAVKDELDAAIDMIFASQHVALHLCRRMYREFVYFDITPEIETDIIEPLAQVLRNNNYEILPVLQTLFRSEHFYDLDSAPTDDNNIGAIIKSPVDLLMGTLRLFNLELPDSATDLSTHYNLYGQLLNQLSLQGIEFFEPYDVAGYDPYFQVPDFQRYWISSNYLANRYKFAEYLLAGINGPTGNPVLRLDIVDFVQSNCSDPANATTLVQELVFWMIPIVLASDRFDYFKNDILLDQLSEVNWSNEWNNFTSSGNDNSVRMQLESLALSIMQSPEYQLY